MKKRYGLTLFNPLVLELGRTSAHDVALVLSLPGREGTVVHQWDSATPWADVEATLLKAVSDWLWLTGGRQERLPGT